MEDPTTVAADSAQALHPKVQTPDNKQFDVTVESGVNRWSGLPLMERVRIFTGFALGGVTLAPLVCHVDPSLNVIVTASLTVFLGCWQSVKPSAPTETMSKEHAMRFPLIGSAVLLSLFLLFKFLPKDLVNMVLTGYFVFLGVLALSATLLPWLELVLPSTWNENVLKWSVPFFKDTVVEFTRAQLVAAVPSSVFCAWYVLKKFWLANNILGLAFSIQGIEMLSLGSFHIGTILLVGLFFYDIFWVFFTPVMVSVAKSFDAPIKLLFPTGDASKPFSLLGLGDIVIPGIFIALALRYDVSQKRGLRYFCSTFIGYVVGLATTIAVMNFFKAAQPALLYIVPAVMGFMAIQAIVLGEVKEIWAYDEAGAVVGHGDDGTAADSKPSTGRIESVDLKCEGKGIKVD